MRRERKEIWNQMNELEKERSIDMQLACGYRPFDFGVEDPYDQSYEVLLGRLAGTYGKTISEYQEMEFEWAKKWFELSDREMEIPFA